MSRVRAFSSPDLNPSNSRERPEGHSFEDQNEACTRDIDDRKAQRLAGMISIIDDVKNRIQRYQSIGRSAELRRCNTDLRTQTVPKDKKFSQPIIDEKEKLRRELSASLAARKSLEIMCSSLGKEREIIATELARKVRELSESEELVNDLRAQNEKLLAKVQACAAEHREKKSSSSGGVDSTALQERNKVLSEQLLKSLDGYRSLKRKLKVSQDENMKMRTAMEEMDMEALAGIDRVHSLHERIATRNNEEADEDISDLISALENLFESFIVKTSKHGNKKCDSPKPKSDTKSPADAPPLA